jgi:hypothetical protein
MNILSLVSQNLDNFYQIQTKCYINSDTVFFSPIHRTKRGRSPIWKVMWCEDASGCSLPVNCACTVKLFDFLVHFYRLNALYISSISLSTCFSSCSGWIWAGLCGSCASRCVSMALTVCQCKDWPVWGTLCSSSCCSVVSTRYHLFKALFSYSQNSKFFHSLSITLIFSRLHGVLNVGKKITNYIV